MNKEQFDESKSSNYVIVLLANKIVINSIQFLYFAAVVVLVDVVGVGAGVGAGAGAGVGVGAGAGDVVFLFDLINQHPSAHLE